MKVLVDECVPVKLLRLLKNHDFVTARHRGWGSFSNGRLLALAEPEFEVFLTADTNIRYQQNLSSRKIAIIVLSTNHWPTLRRHFTLVQNALDKITLHGFVPVEIPRNI